MELLLFCLFLFTSLAHLMIMIIPLSAQSSRISVVGAVYCDTCLINAFGPYSFFIPGADVHVECKLKMNAPETEEMVTLSVNRSTNSRGVYTVEIPSIEGVDCVDGPPIQSMCEATLIETSFTACNIPALKATTEGISVKSKQPNLCVYSFTPLSFRPTIRNDTICSGRHKHDKSSDSTTSAKFLLPPNHYLRL